MKRHPPTGFRSPPTAGGLQLLAAIDINRPPELCYQYWRDFTHLPQFMEHVQSVTVIDPEHTHWLVDGPGDTTMEWDAELIEDLPNERISWRTAEGAQVDNAGSVFFAPLDSGKKTRLKVALTYHPTWGALGDSLSRLFGETADEKLTDDLTRFKETIESTS